MYLTNVNESAKKLFKKGFLIGGKFTSVMKSWESYHPVKIDHVSNFILTSDGIGLFLQNFKTYESLMIKKWLIYQMEILVKLSSSRCTLRPETVFGNWKPFKNDEKCFLFHLKSFLLSRSFSFCLDFLIMYKNGLIKKIRLISNFLT